MLPQQLGDIRNHIDIQVPCVDLRPLEQFILVEPRVSGKEPAHIGGIH
jgi:hypothetical protein